jgi:hypothetical protein
MGAVAETDEQNRTQVLGLLHQDRIESMGK